MKIVRSDCRFLVRWCLVVLTVLTSVMVPLVRGDDFQGSTHLMPFDEGTLNYNRAQADDPITRLQQLLEKEPLAYDEKNGYLDALLERLKIPRSSQVLVFSKTSFQRERISPQSPRALYFNDDVYIGFIPGSPMLEISTADPRLGGVFYTLEQSKEKKPKFVRTDQCLECHASAKSMGVPGHLLRSFMTHESGTVELASGVSQVNHRTPVEERWGGWYVSGKHGQQIHKGNLIGEKEFKRAESEPNFRGNVTELGSFFDTNRYPAASSDIVALMVLEHQVHMHNFLTRLNYETTIQVARYGHINYITNIAHSFLKYMLFTEEAPLKDAISGNSDFTRQFAALGPKDKQGRSLRDFDLQTRIFTYPCSYLIYSQSFLSLPAPMKEHLYLRLWNILTGKDDHPDFEDIPRRTRRAILEILAETHPDLPSYWKVEPQVEARVNTENAQP